MPVNRDLFRSHWAAKRAVSEGLAEANSVIITSQGKRLQVLGSYHPHFIHGAKELGGSWRSRSRIWSFPIATKRLVYDLCVRVYGQPNVLWQSSRR